MLRRRAACAALLLAWACARKPAASERYCAPEGSFCVDAPGVPAVSEENRDVPGQVAVGLKRYEWKAGEDADYTVSQLDYQPGPNVTPDYERAAQSVLDGLARRMDAAVAARAPVEVWGRRGTEVRLESPKGFTLAARAVVADRRTFVYAYGAPAGRYRPEEAARFLGSFVVK